MNNFHIYEEVGKGKYSVVYKVSYIHRLNEELFLDLSSETLLSN